MNILQYTEEEINAYDFFLAWKTNDKEWVKARQNQWKIIKSKLDQMNRFIGIDKELYKYYKNYFIMGYREPITVEQSKNWEYNKQPTCLLRDFNALFAFWLSPDHSQENWDRIKCAHVYNAIRRKDERIGEWDWYKRVCFFFRETAVCYEQVEEYEIKSGAARCRFSPYYNCDPIFDGLEEFFFRSLPVMVTKEGLLDTIPYEGDYAGGGNPHDYFYYLRGDGFNPASPRQYFVDEFLIFGNFITDIFTEHPWEDSRAQLVAMAWHIVANPDGYHSLQIEVAQKLKTGILKLKDQFPEASLDNLERGISMYEEGIKASFYKHYPRQFKGVYYDFMIKKLGLTFWEI